MRFNKTDRTISIECWPRQVDVTQPGAKQFRGWPVKISQLDNYGRAAVAFLPTIQVTGQADPVVQVVDEDGGEVLYTLRIQGTSFRPKVFKQGSYTVHIGEGPARKTLKGIKSIPAKREDVLEVKF